MKIARWIQIVLIGSAWCHHGKAVGLPHFNIEDATKSADAIVITVVEQVRDVGSTEPILFRGRLLRAEAYSAQLSVRRTLKGGPLPEEITVTYPFPFEFVAYSPLRLGTRMVFLRRDKNEYHLADPYYSNFPATLESFGEKTAPENSTELVLTNMLAVLASPTASISEKHEILRVDYALPGNKETIAALRKGLSVSTDPELSDRFRGELIHFNDISELPNVVNLLARDMATQYGRESLLYAIREFLRNPDAVSALNPLLSSPDNEVREAAVEALWHIGSSAAVPALIQKLQDPDEDVRFYAVRGLSDIVNDYGWGGPSESEFHEHEQKYLSHWHEWATNRRQ